MPKPAERADLYWGQEQVKRTPAQVTAKIVSSPEFKEIFGLKLKAIDNRNRTVGKGKQMGRPLRWTALQLESVFLYRRVTGEETLKSAWTRLHADSEARLLLGLGEQVPSRATLTRYLRQHFDESERAEKHLELQKRLLIQVAQQEGFDEEARVLGMDGSLHGTHFTPPITKTLKETSKRKKKVLVLNKDVPKGKAGAITAPTAGFIGKDGGPKAGQGWCLLGLWTEHGTPLSWEITPLNESEKPAAERVLASYESDVLPYRGQQTLSVLTADAGFNSNKIRGQSQSMRLVPNIHKASHKTFPGQDKSETKEAAKRNKTWLPFDDPAKPHYSNWQANGHGELRCACGNFKTKRINNVIPQTGYTTIATRGCCSTCGNVRITSGEWREGRRPKRYVRCYGDDVPDYAIGNSLTFNDPLSKIYGQDRFGWNESIHATIRKRFGLLKDESWMRDITEVRTEFAIAMSAIAVLLLERAACQAQPTSSISSGTSRPLSEIDQEPSLPLAA